MRFSLVWPLIGQISAEAMARVYVDAIADGRLPAKHLDPDPIKLARELEDAGVIKIGKIQP